MKSGPKKEEKGGGRKVYLRKNKRILLNQNLHCNKISRRFGYILKLDNPG